MNHVYITALDLSGVTYSNEASKQNISAWELLSLRPDFHYHQVCHRHREHPTGVAKTYSHAAAKVPAIPPANNTGRIFRWSNYEFGPHYTLEYLLKIDADYEMAEISAGASGKCVGIFYELNKIWNKFRPRN